MTFFASSHNPVIQYYSEIKSLPLVMRGKVRDIYNVDDDHLLIVTTDRLSAFDVVFPDAIPCKGIILNQISQFWFNMTEGIVPNHLTNIDPTTVVSPSERDQVVGRSVVVKKLKPLPIEVVVRGYLVGSGWKDYCRTGTVSGIVLPKGLLEASKLPSPCFTPSTKAVPGSHDENISIEQAMDLCPPGIIEQINDIAIELYTAVSEFSLTHDIIIADTKFEFGLDGDGKLYLIDELFTPDSSRFWKKSDYVVGCSPISYDKQHIRDYVESIGWNKMPPAPRLTNQFITFTTYQYIKIYELLTHQWMII